MTFVTDLDLAPAIASLLEHGAACVEGAVGESARAALSAEVAAGPIHGYREQFGQVRQQIEGFDADEPFEGFPEIGRLARELGRIVHEQAGDVRGLRTWRVNEAGVVRYRPGSIGITPHLDGRRYRRLVAVLTVFGRAELRICRDRAGAETIATFDARPGSLVLLRAPGLAGGRDGRPFHAVGTPIGGERCAIGLRMATSPRPAV